MQEHARANLSDPDLTPSSAARAQGLSVRYLHQLFRDAGTTFGSWLREQRLLQCHDAVADPYQRARSISDIAFTGGFNDAAHFSRVFSQRFGYPPSRLRARPGGR